MWSDVRGHGRTGAELGAFAEGDVAGELGAGVDERARLDLRVTVATGFDRAGDLLEDEVEGLARVFGRIDEGADAIKAVQDAGVAGMLLRWP